MTVKPLKNKQKTHSFYHFLLFNFKQNKTRKLKPIFLRLYIVKNYCLKQKRGKCDRARKNPNNPFGVDSPPSVNDPGLGVDTVSSALVFLSQI